MSDFRALGLFVVLVAFATPPTTLAAAEASAHRQMALTFDDLPYSAPAADEWNLASAQRVTTGILDALAMQEAPATAFVNEAQLYRFGQMDERVGLLAQWVDAGAILGNHTYSHSDLNNVSVDEYEDEIVKGDIVSRKLMEDRQPYQLYFRHPYTHTGDTEVKKVEIERFLAARNYLIAPHTVDSQDYIFNHAYVLARQRNDSALAGRVCVAYVDFVLEATRFAEQTAEQIFGRNIP